MTQTQQRRRGRLARLKRILRPARPVLGPPWRFAKRTFRHDSASSVWTWPDRIRGAAADLTGPLLGRPPIRGLRHHELLALAKRVPYYRRRVTYMGTAARVVDGLIARYGVRTALELGPHLRPLVVGADVMELQVKPDMAMEGHLILHDATVVPWPIADKAYDLFVGLQVFEHLRDHQPQAFREVRRVARHAVLSLPIDWVMPDPTNVHHQLSHERALSWFEPVRPTAVLLGNPEPGKRLIYVFENLPPPEP